MRFLACAINNMIHMRWNRKAGGVNDQKLVFLHHSILCGVQDFTVLYFHCVHRKAVLYRRQKGVVKVKNGSFVPYCFWLPPAL